MRPSDAGRARGSVERAALRKAMELRQEMFVHSQLPQVIGIGIVSSLRPKVRRRLKQPLRLGTGGSTWEGAEGTQAIGMGSQRTQAMGGAFPSDAAAQQSVRKCCCKMRPNDAGCGACGAVSGICPAQPRRPQSEGGV